MGKKIAIIIGVLIIALMVFMMSSNTPASKQSEVKLEPKETIAPKAEVKTDINLQDYEELKKIKELKNMVANQPTTGTSKRYLTTCAPCHGANGKGVMAPDISGKSKDEILSRLKEYKEDKIQNSLMKGLLTNVSDTDLELLADEISNFKSGNEK
ncbi:c-type cytochrome [Campylobacter sp. RM12920]|uniref:C-type cytochrome n=1 Tax=Campylobacter californiensis TaxID=1032243 RepID=A0ABD4JI42_9BACT|nr:c-type cytochrome [Campylobacter sp. RM12919]MBE2987475.1 c-type cytochrome [Campylobacter sp. RM12920]